MSSQMQFSVSTKLSIDTKGADFSAGHRSRTSMKDVAEAVEPKGRLLPPLPKTTIFDVGTTSLVPTPSDERALLINQLDEAAARDRPAATATGGASDEGGDGLTASGLDSKSLESAGLSVGAVDRLYRGIHQYAHAFFHLVEAEAAHVPDAARIKKLVLGQTASMLRTMTSGDGSSYGVKPPIPNRVPGADVLDLEVDAAKRAPAMADVVVEAMSAESSDMYAESSGVSIGDKRGWKAVRENVDLLLRAKGTFELRNQVLQRLLLEERDNLAQLRDHNTSVERRNNDLGAMILDQEAKISNQRDKLHQQMEDFKALQGWADRSIHESGAKLQESHETIRSLQVKMGEMERKGGLVLLKKQELEASLSEASGERDDLKIKFEELKVQMRESETKLKQQYDQYMADIEKVTELQSAFDTAISERDAARELYDTKADEVLDLKDKLEEEGVKQDGLRGEIKKLEGSVLAKEGEIADRDAFSAGLKEEIARLSHCESDLADTRMNLSYALDMTEMMQRQGEKQRLHTEDLWMSSKMNLEAAYARHAEVASMNAKLEAKLKEQHHHIAKLRAKGKDLDNRAVASEEQADSLVKQYEVALDGRARAEAAAEELEKSLAETTKKNWKLEEKLEEYRNDLRDSKRQNTKLEAHTQMLNTKLKETKDASAKAEKKLRADMTRAQKEIASLGAKVDEMAPKVKQGDRLKKNFQELSEKHAALLVDCDKWQKRYESTELEKKGLQEKFDAASRRIDDLNAKLGASEKTCKLLQVLKAENENRIKGLVSQVNALTAERDQLVDDLKEAHTILSSTGVNLEFEKKDNLEKEELLADTQDKLNAALEDVKKAGLEARNLNSKIKVLRGANDELQTKFENTLDRFHQERSAWLEAVNNIRREFSVMWEDIRDDLSGRTEIEAIAGQVHENLANTSRLMHATGAITTFDVIADFKKRMMQEATQIKVRRDEPTTPRHACTHACLPPHRNAQRARMGHPSRDALRHFPAWLGKLPCESLLFSDPPHSFLLPPFPPTMIPRCISFV